MTNFTILLRILNNSSSLSVFIVFLVAGAFVGGISSVIFFFKVVASKADLQQFMHKFETTVDRLETAIKENTTCITNHTKEMAVLNTKMEYLEKSK